MKTKHILKMSCGVTVEAEFDEETATFDCAWTPDPPFSKKLFKKIKREYEPWRDNIFAEWGKRTGQKVMIINI